MAEPRMTRPAVLAVDGGNSKTDVALVAADGSVLVNLRGPGSSPQTAGLERSVAVLGTLVEQVCAHVSISPHDLPIAEHLSACLAGADLPIEEERLHVALAATGWGMGTTVRNDTFALLRAGSPTGWGVAVVCGAGINCVGVGPDGTVTRFPALGVVSGDWGGGSGLAEQALWWAVRSEDGRGPRTVLEQAVAKHFGRTSVGEVSAAFHLRELAPNRLLELVPVLFDCADRGDRVAMQLVERLAREVVLLGSVALRRLGLDNSEAIVVLGGGVLTGSNGRLLAAIRSGFAEAAPAAQLRLLDVPPIVGAALLGLDALGLAGEAESRLRGYFRSVGASTDVVRPAESRGEPAPS